MAVTIYSNAPSTAYVSVGDTWGSALGHYGYVAFENVTDGYHSVTVTDGNTEGRGTVTVTDGNGETTVNI